MKKTAAKSTAKTVASKAAAKPAAAQKKSAPVKKAAPVKAAATKTATVAKRTKAAKAPAPKVKSAPVSTTIIAAIDVGFGNSLTLRGEGAGLSWEVGTPLECAADDRWSITLPETTHPIICKFLLNDVTWSAGEDYTVLPGSSVVLSPVF